MRARGRVAALLAMLLLGGTIQPVAHAQPATSVQANRVTLITGDQVTVWTTDGRTSLQVSPAPRGRVVPFHEFTKRGDRYLVPADAATLVRAGRLDEELFNVTGLIRQGYDDARVSHVPLLVRYGDSGAAVRAETPPGATVRRALPALGMAALEEQKATAARFWNGLVAPGTRATGGIQKVWLNAKARAHLDQSVAKVGAPAAWQAGLTGRGVRVAVLDTGIDGAHPDFAGKVAESKDFTGKGSVKDGHGHGTHVASTVAGSGAAASGKYKGVAPEADLAVGKVLDDAGSGALDWVLAGMQWAAADVRAKVVNMSLGADPTDGTDPLSEAVNTLSRKHGTLFVVSAGNFGSDESVSTPATADDALAVANVSKQDTLSPTSSRGPRLTDGALKPEIAAPGTAIAAARPAGVPPLGEPVGDAYQRMSGTSMAAPHVAGAAAILAQQHPDWPAARLKAALVSSAAEIPGVGPFSVGTGRLDVARATQATLSATGAISAHLPWPNRGQQKRMTVTWHNSATTPVTLRATLTGIPAGLITLGAQSVTVPAGGSAPIDLTATAQDGKPGTFAGVLTAHTADGSVVTRTAVSVRQEEEKHNLTVSPLDRNGAPAANPYVLIINLDTGAVTQSGAGTHRLPRGRYAIHATIDTDRPGQEPAVSAISHPEVVLDRDRTQVLDSRDGKPIQVEADNPAAHGGLMNVARYSKIRACECAFINSLHIEPRLEQVFAATVPGTASDTFAVGVQRRATEPDLELAANDGQPFEVRTTWMSLPGPAEQTNLPVVHGGSGTREDLAKVDARNKLVVVDIPAGLSMTEMMARTSNVKEAGGRLAYLAVAGETTAAMRSAGDFALPTLGMTTASATARRFVAFVKGGGSTVSYVSRPAPNHRYELAYGVERQLTAPQVHRPKTRDLVPVRTAYHGDPARAVYFAAEREFFGSSLGSGRTEPAAAGQERVEYYTPGTWHVRTSSGRRGDLADTLKLTAGGRHRIAWDKAVAGPSFRGLVRTHSNQPPRPWAWRKDNTLALVLPLHGDAAGRPRVPNEDVQINLHRNGVAVPVPPSEFPAEANIPVPAEAADYRLAVEANRGDEWWPLSTSVSATWTFRSSAAEDGKALPLPTIRFDPPVNARNQAPTGRFAFPVFVERQGVGVRAKEFAVEVSYDDGRTWRPADVRPHGDHWRVEVEHPATGFASLRANATDTDGNTVRLSVLKAYQVGG